MAGNSPLFMMDLCFAAAGSFVKMKLDYNSRMNAWRLSVVTLHKRGRLDDDFRYVDAGTR